MTLYYTIVLFSHCTEFYSSPSVKGIKKQAEEYIKNIQKFGDPLVLLSHIVYIRQMENILASADNKDPVLWGVLSSSLWIMR